VKIITNGENTVSKKIFQNCLLDHTPEVPETVEAPAKKKKLYQQSDFYLWFYSHLWLALEKEILKKKERQYVNE
jgi:hypothetical protein